MINIPLLRALSTRRLILLATAASLGVAAVAIDNSRPSLVPAFSTAVAAEAQRPVSFADIVEKVKSSVISVRVKRDGGVKMMGFEGDLPFPPNSRMEQFFRRFGMPFGAPNN